jgi:hypothetical protein
LDELQSELERTEAARDAAEAQRHAEIAALQSAFGQERRQMLRMQETLAQRAARAESVKEQLEIALCDAETRNVLLGEEMLKLRNVRLAKEYNL